MANEPNKIIYSMVRVSKYIDKKPLIENISLSYFYGAKIGVLGLNGAGKSTLLRILAGVDEKFNGETHLAPGHTIGYLEQEPQLEPGKTVREIVEQGVQEHVDLVNEYNALSAKFADPMTDEEMNRLIEQQGDLQEKIDAENLWDLDSRIEQAMDALRCPPGDAHIDHLSGGECRRVALCRLLLSKPDILLLDEPTNHLDAETVGWLEQHLQRYAGTVIAVTHDRYFLDNVAGWILELDRGKGIPYKGNYSSWLDQKEKRLAHESNRESQRLKTLAREREWINMNPRGRHAKSRARIASYNQLLDQSVEKERDLEIYIPPGPRLGNIVIEAQEVSKAYGDTLLFENLSFSLPPVGLSALSDPMAREKPPSFASSQAKNSPMRAHSASATRLASLMSNKPAMSSTPVTTCGRPSRMAKTSSRWATGKSTREPISRASTLQAPISKSPLVNSLAASATAFTSRASSKKAPMSYCWTNRQMTST